MKWKLILQRVRWLIMLALVAVGLVFAPPASANASLTLSLPGAPGSLNVHTSHTFRMVVAGNNGSFETFTAYVQASQGIFIDATALPSGCLNGQQEFDGLFICTLTFAPGGANQTKDFTFTTGHGWAGGLAFAVSIFDEFDNLDDQEGLYPTKGTGYVALTVTANFAAASTINFTNPDTNHYEYVFIQGNFSPAAVGRVVFRTSQVQTTDVDNMTNCSWNGSACVTYYGTWTWGDGAHRSAYITNTSWGTSTYATVTYWNINDTDGQSDEAWVVFMTQVGGVWYKDWADSVWFTFT